MIAFFRRWRERRARTCIALVLGEHLAYEEGHAKRQRERLEHAKTRRHGEYDRDQREHSVFLRARHAYLTAGRTPPANLRALVADVLKG